MHREQNALTITIIIIFIIIRKLASLVSIKNGLQISTLKTKVIYWSKTKNKNHPKHIQIDGQKIEISKSVKYLGVIIDNKLNWNEHIQTAVNKCKKAYSLQKEPSAINGEYHQNK